MKNWFILFFSLLTIPSFAQNTYWAETVEIDSFFIIETNKKGKTISQVKIESDRVDNTQFFFSCDDTSVTSVQLFCDCCQDSIKFTVLSRTDNSHTDTIKIKSGDRISISDAFKKYPGESELDNFLDNPIDYLKVFLGFTQKTLNRRRTQTLRSSEKPKDGDPKLFYAHSDYSYYSEAIDVNIPFEVFNGYPIKSIYITSHDEELILGAGNTLLLSEVFDIKGKTFPSIEKVVRFVSKEEEWQNFQFSWALVHPYLIKKLSRGKWYQVRIELENDMTDSNPYLFNFQLLSEEELKQLQKFITQPTSLRNK